MPLAPGIALVPVGGKFTAFGSAPGSMNGDRLQMPDRIASVPASPVSAPTTISDFFVRKTGSDNNGGSSATTSPDQTGTDGVTDGTSTFTAASAAFTSAHVNKMINVVGKGRCRILTIVSSTKVTLSSTLSSGSSLTWNLGGAVQTIGALLVSPPSSTILSGDRIWIGAGTYREQITITAPSPTYELQINGDVDGKMTGDAGEVRWTGYTTSDTSTPVSGALITIGSRKFFTFQKIVFIGANGNPSCVNTSAGFSDLTFRSCMFLVTTAGGGSNQAVVFNQQAGKPINCLFENCIFVSGGAGSVNGIIQTALATNGGGDMDTNLRIRNCVFIGGNQSIRFATTGSLTGKVGGCYVDNCTFLHQTTAIMCSDANTSPIYPIVVRNSVFKVTTALNANTRGEIIDAGGNVFEGALTNVDLNPLSAKDSRSMVMHYGQEAFYGAQVRAAFSPAAGSGILAAGVTDLGIDLAGAPRPAGTASVSPSAGAYERGNTAAQATSPSPPSGTHVATFTGPGYQDLLLPVSATATTVSVSVQRDASYTGQMPTLELLANAERGVAPGVANASGPTAAWETLTLTFTPATAGLVTLRLHSQDTSGISVVAFANITVA